MTGAADEISALWERLANRLVFLEKRYVFRHGGVSLHPSELHTLLAIRSEPDANTTRLAARLTITKGAASQVMKRLEAKRVIVKRVDPKRKNEVTAAFTILGAEALAAFLAERAAAAERSRGFLASLSQRETTALRRFLELIGESLPKND